MLILSFKKACFDMGIRRDKGRTPLPLKALRTKASVGLWRFTDKLLATLHFAAEFDAPSLASTGLEAGSEWDWMSGSSLFSPVPQRLCNWSRTAASDKWLMVCASSWCTFIRLRVAVDCSVSALACPTRNANQSPKRRLATSARTVKRVTILSIG
jgi:hypothetical protein